MDAAGEVRLGRDGVRSGWLSVAVLAALGAALLWWGLASGLVLVVSYAAAVLLGSSITLFVLLTRLGSSVVVVSGERLVVQVPNGEHRSWPWSEVLEVGTHGTGRVASFLVPGCTVLVRPAGSAWAVPGPNAPLTVVLPVFGRRARRRVQETLRLACDQHGVPFASRGVGMADQPRPGSPLRKR